LVSDIFAVFRFLPGLSSLKRREPDVVDTDRHPGTEASEMIFRDDGPDDDNGMDGNDSGE
jgi:hypothetical protein